MALAIFETSFQLISDDPNDQSNRCTYNRRIYSLDKASVEGYLQERYGAGNVVLHYIELEKDMKCPMGGRRVHPASLDSSLWKTI